MKHPQYNPAIDNAPLTEDDMDELDRWLMAVPHDEVLDMEGVDGFLTALLLAPTLPEADTWLPAIWGGDGPDGPPFKSGKQTKRVVQMVLRHMASIDQQLQKDPDGLEPLFGIAETETDEGVNQLVDAEIWCIGFLLGTSLQPAYWDPLFENAEFADTLTPITLLGCNLDDLTPSQQALVSTPEGRDSLSRQVPEVITELYQHRTAQGHLPRG